MRVSVQTYWGLGLQTVRDVKPNFYFYIKLSFDLRNLNVELWTRSLGTNDLLYVSLVVFFVGFFCNRIAAAVTGLANASIPSE